MSETTDVTSVANALGISEALAKELVSSLKGYGKASNGGIWDRNGAHDAVIDVMQRVMAHLSVKAREAERRKAEVEPA